MCIEIMAALTDKKKEEGGKRDQRGLVSNAPQFRRFCCAAIHLTRSQKSVQKKKRVKGGI